MQVVVVKSGPSCRALIGCVLRNQGRRVSTAHTVCLVFILVVEQGTFSHVHNSATVLLLCMGQRHLYSGNGGGYSVSSIQVMVEQGTVSRVLCCFAWARVSREQSNGINGTPVFAFLYCACFIEWPYMSL